MVYLNHAGCLLLISAQEVVSPRPQNYFVLHVCDVHHKQDGVPEVVLQNAAHDVYRDVVPAGVRGVSLS